jgi:hypothetical protein
MDGNAGSRPCDWIAPVRGEMTASIDAIGRAPGIIAALQIPLRILPFEASIQSALRQASTAF